MPWEVAPTFLLAVVGSVIAGPALGWVILHITKRVQHVPTAIILQFVSTFGVWMLAEHVGLSGVLTTVRCAMTLARTAPQRIPARNRIPSYAVWDTVIFALNILAFIFIGLQIRLEPLIYAPELHDDDPVGRELTAARERALGAGIATLAHDRSEAAELVRRLLMARLSPQGASGAAAIAEASLHSDIARDALQAARQAVLSMRDSDEIGDDAFHRIEEELDWVEMAATNAM